MRARKVRGPGPLPTFLVVGAMRSGTAWLHGVIGAHPDAFVPSRRELHFFDVHWNRGVEWYRGAFAGHRGQAVVGESSPSYLYHAQAAARMAAVVPHARLLAILRHPVDRAYSHWGLNRVRGVEPLDFAEAVEVESARLAGADRMARRRFSYLDRGRYFVQIQRLLRHYPRGSLLVLLHDDLRGDPEGTYRRAVRHVGLDDGTAPSEIVEHVNSLTAFRSRALWRATRELHGPVSRTIGRVNRRPPGIAPLDPELRARLAHGFAADNEALARWLGRGLPAWDR